MPQFRLMPPKLMPAPALGFLGAVTDITTLPFDKSNVGQSPVERKLRRIPG